MRNVNPLVSALLTDKYQLTMAYAYWKSGRHNECAAFDLFFRKCPFGGEFAIFAGLDEVLAFVENFAFSDEDIAFLKQDMPGIDPEFFSWLRTVNTSQVKLYAVAEGTIVFPRVPVIRVEGPLAISQLLETELLNLVNFSSLVATNGARFCMAAKGKPIFEGGLRRGQGPDGALSASRYSYMGGCAGTSNELAGKLFGIPTKGSVAHSYIQSFESLEQLSGIEFKTANGRLFPDFVNRILTIRKSLDFETTNEGELAAFISYANAFPNAFMALVDTYDTLRSGVPNYICVALVLAEAGFKSLGIRLDSGDLPFLSKKARQMFHEIDLTHGTNIKASTIMASNDINEANLTSFDEQGNEIDCFLCGTNLVTCQAQPAMGCVYKLVEVDYEPRIKLSETAEKMTIPGRKEVYRLIGKDEFPIADLMMIAGEAAPRPGEPTNCRHPFMLGRQVTAIPSGVVKLHELVFDGKPTQPQRAITDIRQFVLSQLKSLRPDHLRSLNPTPYKVSVSSALYQRIQQMQDSEATQIVLR